MVIRYRKVRPGEGKLLLQKTFQSSLKGGKLIVQLDSNDRINLIGNAIIVLKGELYL